MDGYIIPVHYIHIAHRLVPYADKQKTRLNASTLNDSLRRAQLKNAMRFLAHGLAPYESAKKHREECKHSSLILFTFSYGL